MKDILKRINTLIGPHYKLVEALRASDYVVISALYRDKNIHRFYAFALYQPFTKELSKLLAALIADGILTSNQMEQFNGLGL